MSVPETAERACRYCGRSDRDLRPYGPEGAFVCLPCVAGDPERTAAARRAFHALMDANAVLSPTGAVVIGAQEGPQPFDPRDAA